MHFALPPNLPGPFETLSRNGTQNRAKKTCAPNHVNKEPWEARPPNVPGAFETLTPQSRSKKDLGRHCPQIYQVRLKPRNSAQNSEKKKTNPKTTASPQLSPTASKALDLMHPVDAMAFGSCVGSEHPPRKGAQGFQQPLQRREVSHAAGA